MKPQDQRAETSDEQADRHRMPRWVRAFIAVGAIAVVIVSATMLTGGADHGPGRHQPETPAETPTSHVPPVDHG